MKPSLLSSIGVAFLLGSAGLTVFHQPAQAEPVGYSSHESSNPAQTLTVLYHSTLIVNRLTAQECQPKSVVFSIPGYPQQPLCAHPTATLPAGTYRVNPNTMELIPNAIGSTPLSARESVKVAQ